MHALRVLSPHSHTTEARACLQHRAMAPQAKAASSTQMLIEQLKHHHHRGTSPQITLRLVDTQRQGGSQSVVCEGALVLVGDGVVAQRLEKV